MVLIIDNQLYYSNLVLVSRIGSGRAFSKNKQRFNWTWNNAEQENISCSRTNTLGNIPTIEGSIILSFQYECTYRRRLFVSASGQNSV
jgi:hypothetical protein